LCPQTVPKVSIGKPGTVLSLRKSRTFGTVRMIAAVTAVSPCTPVNLNHGMVNMDLYAALYGDLPEVKRLLTAGAEVNAKDMHGATALMYASRGGHRKVAELLLARGAEVNAKTTDGRTALMLASESGHRKVAELLLAKGAEVSAKNTHGKTALMYASQKGHREVRELLIKAGAK
jgi:ankyrin repeat protein